ncbi:alpha/beta fold hydrolase [Pigmentiphaga sp. H8]|uniref:alpha/beta fold hydrolase n=1 Tax=unclassified Pigmentiphaga TaxID=2626614 RepID=UPI000F5AA1CC|nr:alpha/beta hydrolase [Pigmentiphaga sp. H8]AZG10672.1 alpha/beta fold hydrolase [Pigmentiphaga sp. H8]
MDISARHPAVGKTVEANGLRTNYHEAGDGPPVIFLHGSGAGVSGWENWHGVMPAFARRHRVLVPDIVGFGFTERQPGARYNIKVWVQHLLGFMDAMGVQQADLVGNSFGGALALAVALRNGHRVRRMVLMGTPAGEFEQRASSARSWYYQPSLENMAELLRTFPHDPAVITDEMVRLRHEVSLLAGGMDAYRKLFPEPGQPGEIRMVKGIPEPDLASIEAPVLVLHGRDDQRVPVECGLRIARRCPRADLHMFGQCGHWVQIERQEAFVQLATSFLA